MQGNAPGPPHPESFIHLGHALPRMTTIHLPTRFIDSALPTITEWKSSLLLPDEERAALEYAVSMDRAMNASISPCSVVGLQDNYHPDDAERDLRDRAEYYQILVQLQDRQTDARRLSDSRRAIVVKPDPSSNSSSPQQSLSFRTRTFMEAIAKLRLDEDLEQASPLKGCAGPGRFKRREGSKIPSVLELAGLTSQVIPGGNLAVENGDYYNGG